MLHLHRRSGPINPRCMQRPHLAALPIQLLRLGAVLPVVVAERLVQRQWHLDAQQVFQQLQALQHIACTCTSAAQLQSRLARQSGATPQHTLQVDHDVQPSRQSLLGSKAHITAGAHVT
jgi:hypothetical protein